MDSEKSLEDDGHFNSETNVESSPLGLEEQYHDKCVQVRPTAMSNRPEQRPALQRCDYLRFLKEVINEIILSLTEGQGGGSVKPTRKTHIRSTMSVNLGFTRQNCFCAIFPTRVGGHGVSGGL